MTQTVEAVYERGIFKPRSPVQLPEHQTVLLSFDVIPAHREQPSPSVRQVLGAAGRLRPLGRRLEESIRAGATLEETRRAFEQAGGEPLSQIIIEQRGAAS